MIANYFQILKKSFTPSRFWNLILVNTSYILSLLLKKPIVWGLPPKLMIEPTNFCNLKCPLCPSGADKLSRNRGYMSLENFQKIIDQVEKHCFVIYLWNQGEPFLHKDIIKMINYATSKRISVIISTNANVMPNLSELVQSGLESLVISLDGITQDTYNKYRINGSIDKVYDNVQALFQAKQELKKEKPTIICQFIIMRHNEHEINRFKAIKIGCDKKVIKKVQIYSKDDINNFLPSNHKHNRYKIINDEFIFKYKIKNRCSRLWNQPVINWDGSISVCCFDKDNIYKIGNVFGNEFSKIWKSKIYMGFRKAVLNNRQEYEMCRNCDESMGR